ncbi:MAG: zinc-dependent alcohol dehydrogenase, partial [Actinomycetota bacterium]
EDPDPGAGALTVALELYRSVPKYLAARAIGPKLPGMIAGPVASLRLVTREDPDLPADGWARLAPRLSGICGSDLTTISGRSSFYFTALVSMPFVPGHEVVADLLEDVDGLSAGQRVIIDPVLSCAARGVEPFCEPCAAGLHGLCERVTGGHVSAGLQTGYCADTGGGWGGRMIAHRAQLHAVPEEMDDRTAIMVEPMACALHAVRRANVPRDATVLVVGAGTVGLLTLIALKAETEAGQIICVAKHGHQAELARRFGATDVVQPSDALGAVRRATRAFRLHPERSSAFLLGGVDLSFECVGSKEGLDLALRAVRAQGRVVLSGMPARADLTPAWFRELELVGAYSGAGAFADAIELAQSAELGVLVGASYPLDRWREAIDHAMSAGKLGTTKVAFDPRTNEESERPRNRRPGGGAVREAPAGAGGEN